MQKRPLRLILASFLLGLEKKGLIEIVEVGRLKPAKTFLIYYLKVMPWLGKRSLSEKRRRRREIEN